MDKQLLISLQTTKAHKFLDDADEMVNQKRWDLAANRYYYACFHIVQAAFIARGISTKKPVSGTLQQKLKEQMKKGG